MWVTVYIQRNHWMLNSKKVISVDMGILENFKKILLLNG